MSKFNPLVPRFAEATWDGLIPESVVFGRDTVDIIFTEDSTRAQIQPLRVFITTYCCSGASSDPCFDSSTNDGYYGVLIDVQRKIKSKWVYGATSAVRYNFDDNSFECVSRYQHNDCRGTYDSKVYDIDLYQVINTWSIISLSTDGDISDTSLHDLIINDENPCKVDLGFIGGVKQLITSLLL